MKLYYLTLWQLMIIVVTGLRNCLVNKHPETMTLKFDMVGIYKTIELRSSNRVLANEFLPVWITTDSDIGFRKVNIMGQIGEFTTYYDDCTKSTFVHFHDRHELYGIVDVKYHIKGLPIDETKKVHIVESKYIHRIMSHERYTRDLHRPIDNTTLYRTRRSSKQKVYPELLLAISHDTYTDIERGTKSSEGIATVSHFLTVYNAADMLFKSIQSAKIQLNIAGIVIEGKPNQWDFESQYSNARCYINVDGIHKRISEYFWRRQNYFPRHSYDIIVYHTRRLLKDDTGDGILGQATPISDGYMFPPDRDADRYSAVVKDFDSYQHFATIAHELSHVFGAEHDGGGLYGYIFDISCGDSLMSEIEGCTGPCLRWSRQTELEFAAFLRTPAYCNFKNYPRSLGVPEPKVIFTSKEQCKCYGYQSNSGRKKNLPENGCSKPLTCISERNGIIDVPLPMDGTPCELGKVCWNGECVQYHIAKRYL